jgi:signal transduction histidine kinase
MVPVVLAAWQYGRWGMWLTLGWAGLLYFLTPFFLPSASFDWMLYAIAGFVQLGVTQILGLTVAALATAQRNEEAALKVANQKLAQQAAIIEQLATGRERTRLARELHDTLAHTLSATAVQLQAIGTLLKVSPETAVVELASAQQQIRHSLEEARRAITALRASPLEELGLAEALRQRLQTIGDRAGLSTHCQIAPPLPPLPPLIEQTIYRIADEALLNAEKYAQANQLHLSLDHGPDWLILTVQDDGIGFEVERVSGNGRFGIIGMKERAVLIGATLSVSSRPPQGTTVQLSLRMANGE